MPKKIKNASRTSCFVKLSRTENHEQYQVPSVRPERRRRTPKGFFTTLLIVQGGTAVPDGLLTMPPTGCNFALIKVGAGRLS